MKRFLLFFTLSIFLFLMPDTSYAQKYPIKNSVSASRPYWGTVSIPGKNKQQQKPSTIKTALKNNRKTHSTPPENKSSKSTHSPKITSSTSPKSSPQKTK